MITHTYIIIGNSSGILGENNLTKKVPRTSYKPWASRPRAWPRTACIINNSVLFGAASCGARGVSSAETRQLRRLNPRAFASSLLDGTWEELELQTGLRRPTELSPGLLSFLLKESQRKVHFVSNVYWKFLYKLLPSEEIKDVCTSVSREAIM